MNNAVQPLVVGLGEALYDCFPQRRVLGGAPLNVAVHADALLKPLGGAAVPATRVGIDELGDEVIETLSARGVDVDWVQRDCARPTGQVTVQIDDSGDVSYEFQADSAWDAIEMTPNLERLARRSDAVAFGALAQRSGPSRGGNTAVSSCGRPGTTTLRCQSPAGLLLSGDVTRIAAPCDGGQSERGRIGRSSRDLRGPNACKGWDRGQRRRLKVGV